MLTLNTEPGSKQPVHTRKKGSGPALSKDSMQKRTNTTRQTTQSDGNFQSVEKKNRPSFNQCNCRSRISGGSGRKSWTTWDGLEEHNRKKDLENHSILSYFQHGFRKRRNCESQRLIAVLHDRSGNFCVLGQSSLWVLLFRLFKSLW